MSVDLTNAELKTARRVATEQARRFRGIVEAGDIEQELSIWMLTHEEKVREWREGNGFRALYRSLWHEASRFCKREKARVSGYEPADQAGYSAGHVREVLPMALSQEWANESPVGGRPHSNAAVMVMDVRYGLQLLDDKDAKVLARFVEVDLDYDSLARALGVEYQAAWRRVDRAINRLVAVLNDDTDGPESEESLREWQNQLYKDVPRYSSAGILAMQEEHDPKAGPSTILYE